MKIVMNKKQLLDLIKKYQKEEMDFDGEVKLVAEEYHDMRDDYTAVKAVMTGKLQLLGETYDLTHELNEREIEDIIKLYLEKAGYKAGYIRFTSKEKHYDAFERDDADLVFDNVEIEIKGNAKTKGTI